MKLRYKRSDSLSLHLHIAFLRGHLDRAETTLGPDDPRVLALKNRVAYYSWLEEQRRLTS